MPILDLQDDTSSITEEEQSKCEYKYYYINYLVRSPTSTNRKICFAFDCNEPQFWDFGNGQFSPFCRLHIMSNKQEKMHVSN